MRIFSLLVMFQLIGNCFSFVNTQKLVAVHKKDYDNYYESSNAVRMQYVSSLAGCMVECTKEKQCLSYFFNTITKDCVLHSDPFTYTKMTESGDGWTFYLTHDGKRT